MGLPIKQVDALFAFQYKGNKNRIETPFLAPRDTVMTFTEKIQDGQPLTVFEARRVELASDGTLKVKEVRNLLNSNPPDYIVKDGFAYYSKSANDSIPGNLSVGVWYYYFEDGVPGHERESELFCILGIDDFDAITCSNLIVSDVQLDSETPTIQTSITYTRVDPTKTNKSVNIKYTLTYTFADNTTAIQTRTITLVSGETSITDIYNYPVDPFIAEGEFSVTISCDEALLAVGDAYVVEYTAVKINATMEVCDSNWTLSWNPMLNLSGYTTTNRGTSYVVYGGSNFRSFSPGTRYGVILTNGVTTYEIPFSEKPYVIADDTPNQTPFYQCIRTGEVFSATPASSFSLQSDYFALHEQGIIRGESYNALSKISLLAKLINGSDNPIIDYFKLLSKLTGYYRTLQNLDDETNFSNNGAIVDATNLDNTATNHRGVANAAYLTTGTTYELTTPFTVSENDVTISFWWRFASVGYESVMRVDGGSILNIRYAKSLTQLYVKKDTTDNNQINIDLAQNTWHHIVVVAKFLSVSAWTLEAVYVNNVKYTTFGTPANLGDFTSATDINWLVDAVPARDTGAGITTMAVFNRALTDAQVSELYNNDITYDNLNIPFKNWAIDNNETAINQLGTGDGFLIDANYEVDEGTRVWSDEIKAITGNPPLTYDEIVAAEAASGGDMVLNKIGIDNIYNMEFPNASITPRTIWLFSKDSYINLSKFITRYNVTGGDTLTLPLPSGYNYNFTVDWGDGSEIQTITAYNDPNISHTYSTTGFYNVIINGLCEAWSFNNSGTTKDKLVAVLQWGNTGFISLKNGFRGCSNLSYVENNSVFLNSTIDINAMFYSCTAFNSDISNWDTSNVTDMGLLFFDSAFNSDISNWDTSNVINFAGTFYKSAFNQPVNDWDVSNVINFSDMFRECPFNHPLNNWVTSSATIMSQMFRANTSFNYSIDNFDVSGVTTLEYMFQGATAFNQNLNSWNLNTSGVVVRYMFQGATIFNGNISNWNTIGITDMLFMFRASAFNQDISSWNVSNVTSMFGAFSLNTSFNQNISGWNVSNVIDMRQVFSGTTSFDQNLGVWNISSMLNGTDMFSGVTLSTVNYDALLQGWAAQVVNPGVVFDGGNSTYTIATTQASRDTLTNAPNNWVITDGGGI